MIFSEQEVFGRVGKPPDALRPGPSEGRNGLRLARPQPPKKTSAALPLVVALIYVPNGRPMANEAHVLVEIQKPVHYRSTMLIL